MGFWKLLLQLLRESLLLLPASQLFPRVSLSLSLVRPNPKKQKRKRRNQSWLDFKFCRVQLEESAINAPINWCLVFRRKLSFADKAIINARAYLFSPANVTRRQCLPRQRCPVSAMWNREYAALRNEERRRKEGFLIRVEETQPAITDGDIIREREKVESTSQLGDSQETSSSSSSSARRCNFKL